MTRASCWRRYFAADADYDRPRMTLALEGELDLASAASPEREIEALPWSQLAELVLDPTEVTFIDGSSLHALIRASQRAATERLRLAVAGASEQTRKLFTLVGVTESLNVQPAAGGNAAREGAHWARSARRAGPSGRPARDEAPGDRSRGRSGCGS
jgi:anti-anti-sigma factor